MKFALITGISGVGKNYSSDRIIENFPKEVLALNFDKVVNYIKKRKYDKDLQFIPENFEPNEVTTLYQEYLQMEKIETREFNIVQGYQLILPWIRDPMLKLLAASSDNCQIFGIFPTVERIIQLRKGSSKSYHLEHTDEPACSKSYNYWKEEFSEIQGFTKIEVCCSDSAVEKVSKYFRG